MAAARPIAFVTGASRGIGAATARALAAKGYDLALAARTLHEGERHEYGDAVGEAPLPGSLDATAASVRERGARALALRLDLLEPASIEAAVGACEQQLGPIDALVNNAIVQLPGMMSRVLDSPPDVFARVLDGNVVSQLRLVQRVLPGMLARGRGAIVNLVSASGALDPPAPVGEGGWSFVYSASKAAFMRLTGVLAVEHEGSGVRFFDVEPGFVLTELMQQSTLRAGFAEQWRGAPPEVPAAVIAWLLTDPGADAWHGRMAPAQKLCKQLGLVPGWPPPRAPSA